MMTALPVEAGGADIRPGQPTPLFPTGLSHGRQREYDVTPDGKRFLMVLTPSGSPADTPITVIVNWPKLLERK
jgi:hypothetical protein